MLSTPVLGERMHSLGVVFHEELGISEIIFEQGGYDGFDDSELKSFCKEEGFDKKSSCYKFKNVMQVETDYEKGYWDHVFKKYKDPSSEIYEPSVSSDEDNA